MNRAPQIIAVAVAVYFAALGVAWRVGTDHAYAKTEKLLEQSERIFVESIGDYVDAMLMQASVPIFRDLGGTAAPVAQRRLRELCGRYVVDELNIVGTNGICLASTMDGDVGLDFHAHPQTAEFLALLHGARYVCQPYRQAVGNSGSYRKYLGLPFPDGSGFLQLGMDFNRAYDSMTFLDRPSLQAWRIGRNGHYDVYDFDEDGRCDYTGSTLEDGKVVTGYLHGDYSYVRAFTYAGHRFVSVLSFREYFDERNLNFAIMAPTLAGVVLFLAWVVLSMSRTAERDRRHRAAEDEARCREMSLARTIQMSALDSAEPYRREFPALAIDAVSHPAREVGGDFYGFRRLDRARLAFVIADVSGKGIPAAMFMMRAKNEIIEAIAGGGDLATAAALANARICEGNQAELFVTAWIGVVDTEKGVIEYVNAGHNRPFLRRASGAVEKVMGRGGRFFGMFPEAKYRSETLTLKPGDALFLYTDGITEAMNASREQFGEKRLAELLGKTDGRNPRDQLAEVVKAVRRHADRAEQSDDLTAVAVVWRGETSRSERTFKVDAATSAEALAFLRSEVKLENAMRRARLFNAADEFIANVVGYSGARELTVLIENTAGVVRVTLADDGRAFNPLESAEPDTALPLADRPIGGLGILMSRRLVDSVDYRRQGGRNFLMLLQCW